MKSPPLSATLPLFSHHSLSNIKPRRKNQNQNYRHSPEKPEMAEIPIRFGILGCAEIARKLSRAIKLAPNAHLYAIGSRSIEKATRFAGENGFPADAKIYGSYDGVLDDPSVDAVYVPLPTSLHRRWAVEAAKKKKHVLLEKPTAIDVGELDLILEACDSNGVQFMDATMWMHHPRTGKMKEFLGDKELFGELKSVHSNFTFGANADFLDNDIRVKPDLEPLGALGDIGWYCIRSILWAADFELPRSVTALQGAVLNKAGVILACGASLLFGDGKTATFQCSFLANMSMDVTVMGTKGTLHLNDFVIPFGETSAAFFFGSNNGFTELVTGWSPLPSEHFVTTDLPQEALMVIEFARLVRAIKESSCKPEKKWPEITRKTQSVLDAVKLSIEKGFETVTLFSHSSIEGSLECRIEDPRNIRRPISVDMGSRDAARARWNEYEKKCFIECCIDEANNGGRSGSSLTKAAWNRIIVELKKRIGKEFNQKQLKNLWDYLKAQYTAWIKLLSITGNGYNPSTGQFDWPAERWDKYIKVNKNASSFRTKPLSFKNELRSLFDGYVPSVTQAYTPNSEAMPVDEYIESSTQIPLHFPSSDNEINLDSHGDVANIHTSESSRSPIIDLKEAHFKGKRRKKVKKNVIKGDMEKLIMQLEKKDNGPTVANCFAKLKGMTSLPKTDPLYFVALSSFTKNEECRQLWMLLEDEDEMKTWLKTLQ